MDYHDSNVLVFGGLGFIGLNLVQALVEQRARVTVVTRSSPALGLQWLEQIRKRREVKLVLADLNSPELYQRDVSESDVIFNLAGHSGAAKSLIEAHTDMRSNVEGNLAILEVVRFCKKRPRVVFVSSRLVYGHTGSAPVSEERILKPTSIYGLHKLTVEHYYGLYYQHYGIPYACMRLTNPYGPYQMPERHGYGVLNLFMMRAVQGQAISMYGDGNQLRDYIFIEDVVRALMLMGQHAEVVDKILNIGYGTSIRIAEAAEAIVSVAGSGSIAYVPWPDIDRRVETGDFVCDISLARKLLQWEPMWDLETGLAQSVAHYRQLLKSDMYEAARSVYL